MGNFDLSQGKIIERHSIYVIGVHEMLCSPQVLTSRMLFGRFGLIKDIRIGEGFVLAHCERRYSVYITYESTFAAALAIAAMQDLTFKGSIFQCSFSTNKYCKEYLSGRQCSKANCKFIHQPVLLKDFF